MELMVKKDMSETNLPDVQNPEKTINLPLAPAATPMIPRIWKPKWEKALPEKYTILAIGESNSLKLKVELETTDTSERKSVRGHPLKLIPITKSNDPAPGPTPTFYIPPHHRQIQEESQ